MTLVQSRSFKVVLSGSDPKEKEGLGRRNREGRKAKDRGLHGPENQSPWGSARWDLCRADRMYSELSAQEAEEHKTYHWHASHWSWFGPWGVNSSHFQNHTCFWMTELVPDFVLPDEGRKALRQKIWVLQNISALWVDLPSGCHSHGSSKTKWPRGSEVGLKRCLM